MRYFCDMRGFDPFRAMRDEQKKYGWVLTFRENPATAPTLWRTVRRTLLWDAQHADRQNSCGRTPS